MTRAMPWLVVLGLLCGCSDTTSRGGARTRAAATRQEAMERFAKAMLSSDYPAAYETTATRYREKVTLTTFLERQKRVHEGAGRPTRWAVPEMGCFQSNGDHGCGIAFGNKELDGELLPIYTCIVVFREEGAGVMLDEIDCRLETDLQEPDSDTEADDG